MIKLMNRYKKIEANTIKLNEDLLADLSWKWDSVKEASFSLVTISFTMNDGSSHHIYHWTKDGDIKELKTQATVSDKLTTDEELLEAIKLQKKCLVQAKEIGFYILENYKELKD